MDELLAANHDPEPWKQAGLKPLPFLDAVMTEERWKSAANAPLTEEQRKVWMPRATKLAALFPSASDEVVWRSLRDVKGAIGLAISALWKAHDKIMLNEDGRPARPNHAPPVRTLTEFKTLSPSEMCEQFRKHGWSGFGSPPDGKAHYGAQETMGAWKLRICECFQMNLADEAVDAGGGTGTIRLYHEGIEAGTNLPAPCFCCSPNLPAHHEQGIKLIVDGVEQQEAVYPGEGAASVVVTVPAGKHVVHAGWTANMPKKYLRSTSHHKPAPVDAIVVRSLGGRDFVPASGDTNDDKAGLDHKKIAAGPLHSNVPLQYSHSNYSLPYIIVRPGTETTIKVFWKKQVIRHHSRGKSGRAPTIVWSLRMVTMEGWRAQRARVREHREQEGAVRSSSSPVSPSSPQRGGAWFAEAKQARFDWRTFRAIRSDKDFTEGVYFGKGEVRKKKLVYQGKKVLHKSLTSLPAAGNKMATNMHECLLGYCGDKTMSFPAMLAQNILRAALDNRELVDECYLQLCKHITGNTIVSSRTRAWQVMCMCVGTFPPSAEFQPVAALF